MTKIKTGHNQADCTHTHTPYTHVPVYRLQMFIIDKLHLLLLLLMMMMIIIFFFLIQNGKKNFDKDKFTHNNNNKQTNKINKIKWTGQLWTLFFLLAVVVGW